MPCLGSMKLRGAIACLPSCPMARQLPHALPPHPMVATLLQFSRFALHFVDADAEEQRGLYATLAGCLCTGDAAGAASWVRKYAA